MIQEKDLPPNKYILATLNIGDTRTINFWFGDNVEFLKAYVNKIDGTSQNLVYGSDFYVNILSGAGKAYGEFVANKTFRDLKSLVLDRQIPKDQLLPFSDIANLANATEFAADKLTAIAQDSSSNQDRTLRFPKGTIINELPPEEEMAGKLLGFDADGEPIGIDPGDLPAEEVRGIAPINVLDGTVSLAIGAGLDVADGALVANGGGKTLYAGANIQFSDETASEITINAPNAKALHAGNNISFSNESDTDVTINAEGGSGGGMSPNDVIAGPGINASVSGNTATVSAHIGDDGEGVSVKPSGALTLIPGNASQLGGVKSEQGATPSFWIDQQGFGHAAGGGSGSGDRVVGSSSISVTTQPDGSKKLDAIAGLGIKILSTDPVYSSSYPIRAWIYSIGEDDEDSYLVMEGADNRFYRFYYNGQSIAYVDSISLINSSTGREFFYQTVSGIVSSEYQDSSGEDVDFLLVPKVKGQNFMAFALTPTSVEEHFQLKFTFLDFFDTDGYILNDLRVSFNIGYGPWDETKSAVIVLTKKTGDNNLYLHRLVLPDLKDSWKTATIVSPELANSDVLCYDFSATEGGLIYGYIVSSAGLFYVAPFDISSNPTIPNPVKVELPDALNLSDPNVRADIMCLKRNTQGAEYELAFVAIYVPSDYRFCIYQLQGLSYSEKVANGLTSSNLSQTTLQFDYEAQWLFVQLKLGDVLYRWHAEFRRVDWGVDVDVERLENIYDISWAEVYSGVIYLKKENDPITNAYEYDVEPDKSGISLDLHAGPGIEIYDEFGRLHIKADISSVDAIRSIVPGSPNVRVDIDSQNVATVSVDQSGGGGKTIHAGNNIEFSNETATDVTINATNDGGVDYDIGRGLIKTPDEIQVQQEVWKGEQINPYSICSRPGSSDILFAKNDGIYLTNSAFDNPTKISDTPNIRFILYSAAAHKYYAITNGVVYVKRADDLYNPDWPSYPIMNNAPGAIECCAILLINADANLIIAGSDQVISYISLRSIESGGQFTQIYSGVSGQSWYDIAPGRDYSADPVVLVGMGGYAAVINPREMIATVSQPASSITIFNAVCNGKIIGPDNSTYLLVGTEAGVKAKIYVYASNTGFYEIANVSDFHGILFDCWYEWDRFWIVGFQNQLKWTQDCLSFHNLMGWNYGSSRDFQSISFSRDKDMFVCSPSSGIPLTVAKLHTPFLLEVWPGQDLIFDSIGRLAVDLNTAFGHASKTQFGVVKIGDNIDVTDDLENPGIISVPVASNSALGVVKIGENINNTDGTISVPISQAQIYGVVRAGANIDNVDGTLAVPAATQYAYGVAKSGDHISNDNGVFSVPTASDSVFGVVKIGANINNSAGAISISIASSTVFGLVKIGENLNNDNGVISGVVSQSKISEILGDISDVATIANTAVGIANLAKDTGTAAMTVANGAMTAVNGLDTLVNIIMTAVIASKAKSKNGKNGADGADGKSASFSGNTLVIDDGANSYVVQGLLDNIVDVAYIKNPNNDVNDFFVVAMGAKNNAFQIKYNRSGAAEGNWDAENWKTFSAPMDLATLYPGLIANGVYLAVANAKDAPRINILKLDINGSSYGLIDAGMDNKSSSLNKIVSCGAYLIAVGNGWFSHFDTNNPDQGVLSVEDYPDVNWLSAGSTTRSGDAWYYVGGSDGNVAFGHVLLSPLTHLIFTIMPQDIVAVTWNEVRGLFFGRDGSVLAANDVFLSDIKMQLSKLTRGPDEAYDENGVSRMFFGDTMVSVMFTDAQ